MNTGKILTLPSSTGTRANQSEMEEHGTTLTVEKAGRSRSDLLHLPAQSQPFSKRSPVRALVRQSVGGGRSKHVEVEDKPSGRTVTSRLRQRRRQETATGAIIPEGQGQSVSPLADSSSVSSGTSGKEVSSVPEIVSAGREADSAGDALVQQPAEAGGPPNLAALPASGDALPRFPAEKITISDPTGSEFVAAKAGELAAEPIPPERSSASADLPGEVLLSWDVPLPQLVSGSLSSRREEMAELQRIQGKQQRHTQQSGQGNNVPEKVVKVGKQPGSREFSRVSAALPADEEEEPVRRKGRRAGGHGRGSSLASRERSRNAGRVAVREIGEDLESREQVRRGRTRRRPKTVRVQQPKVLRRVDLPEAITVRELAGRMAERSKRVISVLEQLGMSATLDRVIDADTAELVAVEFGHSTRRTDNPEGLFSGAWRADTDEIWQSRPPVVAVMGHVDHGKTSLLDALRHSAVASKEVGSITQHIGAYQVTMGGGRKITFIDTPGHAAFTAMRARGSQVTDIVVLVVAADDGVKSQTLEAIQHATAAQTPIVVAINKIDLPQAQPERVRRELAQYGLLTEDMGGDLLCVELSATKHMHLDRLRESILLSADLMELKARQQPSVASGVVLEARQERGQGPVSTFLVQHGALKIGDILVAGKEWGRVRSLFDDRGQAVDQALPSTPVEVLGLSAPPDAGDQGQVVANEQQARTITAFRLRKERQEQTRISVAELPPEQLLRPNGKSDHSRELPLVIKCDTRGSVEAVKGALEQLTLGTDEIELKVIGSGVGAINESDVTLAQASKALVIGFNVRANHQACELAKRERVELRYHALIYDVIEGVKATLSNMLTPIRKERIVGTVQVLQVFDIHKVGKVAGCRVTSGRISRGTKIRVLRDHEVVRHSILKTLKRFKEDVREVRLVGQECGIALENCDDIYPEDILEAFEIEERVRTL